jgi:hypothetical protein
LSHTKFIKVLKMGPSIPTGPCCHKFNGDISSRGRIVWGRFIQGMLFPGEALLQKSRGRTVTVSHRSGTDRQGTDKSTVFTKLVFTIYILYRILSSDIAAVVYTVLLFFLLSQLLLLCLFCSLCLHCLLYCILLASLCNTA